MIFNSGDLGSTLSPFDKSADLTPTSFNDVNGEVNSGLIGEYIGVKGDGEVDDDDDDDDNEE